MKQETLDLYKTLDDSTKEHVNIFIKSLSNIPEFTNKISDEEKAKIKEKQKEIEEKNNKEREIMDNYCKELSEKCILMTKKDYIDELDEIFNSLDLYKLKWFYKFIKVKLFEPDKEN